MLTVRPATLHDLNGLMAVENAKFGDLEEGGFASRKLMRDRILLCNSPELKWFWVAESKKRIVGYMLMQPTDIEPDECSSWEKATDNGTLKRTFNAHGKNLYGVSLGILNNAPDGTIEFLMQRQFVMWMLGNKKYFMICARMPGYREHHEKTGMSAEEYWQAKDKDGKPIDGMLRHFSEYVGVAPVRLLPNGFPADKDSCGHAVLCAGEDPVGSLAANARHIYQACRKSVKGDKK